MQSDRLVHRKFRSHAMPLIIRLFTFLCVIMAIQLAVGRELAVPQDYGSIRAALLDLQSGDTVVISPGAYVESLEAPAMDFVMRGTSRIDSQTTEFSIIDPTDLPGSDTLLSVRLTGGNAHFVDMVFRNRIGMTNDRPQGTPGGIMGDTSVLSISFERCVFDSVVGAVSDVDSITVSNCRFIGCRGAVNTGFWRGTLYADSTWFDGASGSLVNTQEGCKIRDCLFTHAGQSAMFNGVGDSVIIENCHFVGMGSTMSDALLIRPRCGSEIKRCVFENIEVLNDGVIEIRDSCSLLSEGMDCAIKIFNNRFVRCGGPIGNTQPGGVMIRIRCGNIAEAYAATLENNHIDSTRLIYGNASGIEVNASCRISNTVFGDALAPNKPQIFVEGRGYEDTLVLRTNSFSRLSPGIEYVSYPRNFVDARDNWWGDESGPYHGDLNPNGQGAQVDDHILFDPWLTVDPDSSDTNGVAVDRDITLTPSDYQLYVYPNPFNAVTTLEIEVVRTGDYEVVMYDVTGREAARVFRGRIDGRMTVAVDASNFASGVYFAKLSGDEGILVTEKLLLLK